MPGADPAHIQQRGDYHKIAMALREQRVGSTEVAKAGSSRSQVAKAGSSRTQVAKAR
jgi:hypothetical protein